MGLGVAFALVTSVSWAVANVCIQRSGQALGVVRALLWAMLIGGLAAGLAAVPLGETPRIPAGRELGLLGLCVLFGLIANLGMFAAFAHGRLVTVTPVVSSWSVVAALLSWLVLGERVAAPQLGAAAVVFAGVMLVAVGAGRRAHEPASDATSRRARTLAALAALAASLGFGALMPTLALLGPRVGELTATGLLCLGYVVVGVPLALLARRPLGPPRGGRWRVVVAAGLAEALGIAALVLARRHAPMTVVGPLSSLASAFTVLYAWVVLRDRPPRLVLVGAALCCLGVILLAG